MSAIVKTESEIESASEIADAVATVEDDAFILFDPQVFEPCGGVSKLGRYRCVLQYLHDGPHSNSGWEESGRMWLEDDFDP